MPIPVWVLLGFATWTLLILFATVGVYRWSRILTGRTAIAAWRADEMQGTEWYRRAIRAHMNCVENLPIYTAIVVALLAARVTSPLLDGLAIVILLARICQSSHSPAHGADKYRREHSFRVLFCPSGLHGCHGGDSCRWS